MGWLIALAVLVGLAVLPLGVSAVYGEAGAQVAIIAGPVHIRLFPKNKKKKPEKPKEKKEKPAKPAKSAPPAENKETGGSITDFLPLVRTALDFVGEFRRKLRVNDLQLRLTMAGDDPCDLGVNYGRAWAAVGNLMPRLERLFVIKKRDIRVDCDFTAEKTTIFARLDLTITLGRLLSLAVRYGVRALREFLAIQKQRKGGTAK